MCGCVCEAPLTHTPAAAHPPHGQITSSCPKTLASGALRPLPFTPSAVFLVISGSGHRILRGVRIIYRALELDALTLSKVVPKND